MNATQQAEQILEAAANEDAVYQFDGRAAPERIAWVVLLGAFALFCSVALTTIFGVYHYLFRSTAPMPAMLQVAKGTVGITGADLIEAVERGEEDLTNTQTSISTDSLSQATIQLRDLGQGQGEPARLLAAVTLQRNTFVTYNYARRPRFEWSREPQRIQFSRLSGELDVLVAGASGHPFVMDIYTDALNTEGGLHIQLVKNGRYRIGVSEDEVRVLNLHGEAAAFFGDDPGTRHPAPVGEELVVRIGNRRVAVDRGRTELLASSHFSLQNTSMETIYASGVPLNWSCGLLPEQEPPGSYSLVNRDGRIGLALRRFNNATSHGEIGCLQEFEAPGLDASDYESLRVLATFRLDYQSLSLCGKLGSECPLMLQIRYRHRQARGVDSASWFRGFYYEEESSGAYKKLCASCLQDHVDTNQAVWYSFDSGNILSLFAEADQGIYIDSIRFYASGHQFDTVVSEVILLATRAPDEGGQS